MSLLDTIKEMDEKVKDYDEMKRKYDNMKYILEEFGINNWMVENIVKGSINVFTQHNIYDDHADVKITFKLKR